MGRLQRAFLLEQAVTVTCGSSDTQTALDLIAPFVGARVDRVTATQKTVGSGTGTFTLALCELNAAGTTASTFLSNTITVDADTATATIHGTALGNGTAATATGQRLAVTTTKTGTVTGSITAILSILWQM